MKVQNKTAQELSLVAPKTRRQGEPVFLKIYPGRFASNWVFVDQKQAFVNADEVLVPGPLTLISTSRRHC
jgi:tRNA A37 threonylcarbamoyladenosine synthetase subunit TsaC/SUA5/YrdC